MRAVTTTTPPTTTPVRTTALDLVKLLHDFELLTPEADLWLDAEADDLGEAEDCDVLSDLFATHCRDRGVDARVVAVEMRSEHESMLDVHYVTVLGPAPIAGLAVDWTARQFHNAAGVNLDVAEIPCPLVFPFPGPYPLPTLTAEVTDRSRELLAANDRVTSRPGGSNA